MVASADVEALREAQAALSLLAQQEVADLVSTIVAEADPAAARDVLVQLVPQLAAEYGDAAVALAATWFEQVYGVPAVIAAPLDRAVLEQAIRYPAGHLWTPGGEPAGATAIDPLTNALAGKVDAWVKQGVRDTVRESAWSHDMGWARVPRGAKTCAWCLILASRGAVYRSRQSATTADGGERYHGHCDCTAVAVRGPDEYPDGYDPDALYNDLYLPARNAAGSGDIESIAAAMRESFPDMVTDGHVSTDDG